MYELEKLFELQKQFLKLVGIEFPCIRGYINK